LCAGEESRGEEGVDARAEKDIRRIKHQVKGSNRRLEYAMLFGVSEILSVHGIGGVSI
jgi:hypothetical protein